jgi:hypothetical protein
VRYLEIWRAGFERQQHRGLGDAVVWGQLLRTFRCTAREDETARPEVLYVYRETIAGRSRFYSDRTPGHGVGGGESGASPHHGPAGMFGERPATRRRHRVHCDGEPLEDYRGLRVLCLRGPVGCE